MQEKWDKLLEMLDSGPRGLVALHVNPDVDGVVLPAYLMVERDVRLNVAYGYNLPTFNIGPEGVDVMLKFSSRPFLCILPWESIWAMLSPEENNIGYMWALHNGEMVTVGPKKEPEKPKNPFRVIQGGKK